MRSLLLIVTIRILTHRTLLWRWIRTIRSVWACVMPWTGLSIWIVRHLAVHRLLAVRTILVGHLRSRRRRWLSLFVAERIVVIYRPVLAFATFSGFHKAIGLQQVVSDTALPTNGVDLVLEKGPSLLNLVVDGLQIRLPSLDVHEDLINDVDVSHCGLLKLLLRKFVFRFDRRW